MRKILITDNYGAGWSSWCDRIDIARFMATYQPIIDLLDQNEYYFEDKYPDKFDPIKNPVVKQLAKDIKDKFNITDDLLPHFGAIFNLRVVEIPDDCYAEISDYDGKEDYKLHYGLI